MSEILTFFIDIFGIVKFGQEVHIDVALIIRSDPIQVSYL